MKTLVRVSTGMLLSVVLCPTSVFGQTIDSMDQFGEFRHTYYLEPRPQLIPAAMIFLNTSALASNPDRAPLVTMSLSCILHRPELEDRSWDAELAKLREPARGVVQKAIVTEPDALLAQVPISPTLNDMNWACFFGSGEEKYLDNLVNALSHLIEEKDLNSFLTGATAMWSLSSNALAHARVKAKLDNLRATKGQLQPIAVAILTKSPEELRAETTAYVKEQRQQGVW
jgi:hypothetical protein